MNIYFRVILIALLALSARQSFASGLCGSDSMFFNGSHTSWVPQPMMCNENTGNWELRNVLLPENSLVGFDMDGNWKYTYGGRGGLSGSISNKYENIWITQSGIYDIEIDFIRKNYSLIQAENQDIGSTLSLLPESPQSAISPRYAQRPYALASCSDAECTRQYARDSASCRKIPNARARAICWAAAAVRYGACLARCK